MRKVNSGSIFRLGRCNTEVLQSVGAERKLLSVSHAVAVGFLFNARILLCRLQH